MITSYFRYISWSANFLFLSFEDSVSFDSIHFTFISAYSYLWYGSGWIYQQNADSYIYNIYLILHIDDDTRTRACHMEYADNGIFV